MQIEFDYTLCLCMDTLYKNDGKSMLVYDFFNFSDEKFGEKDWTKSNETLDLLGVWNKGEIYRFERKSR